jgi:hypothetical protein
VFAIADGVGRLLWVEGDSATLRRAESINFVAGTDWAETLVGTNAPGTALALGQPVQIITEEHFNEAVRPWTCAAAPVRDPDSGDLLGAVDLTGGAEVGGSYALAAVRATARAMETELARRMHLQDLRSWSAYAELIRSGTTPTALVSPGGRVLHADPGMPPGLVSLSRSTEEKLLPDGCRLITEEIGGHGYLVVRFLGGRRDRPDPDVLMSALGADNALVETGGRKLRLSPRHSEILVLLVLAGEGMSAGRLAVELSPEDLSTVAVRADMSRLRAAVRASLGVDLLESQPYRVSVDVRCDIHKVADLLAEGRPEQILAAYPGPLLPSSQAPAVVEHRTSLEQQVRGAVLASRDPATLRTWLGRPCGREDLLAWETLASVLPVGSAQRGAALGRARALRESS